MKSIQIIRRLAIFVLLLLVVCNSAFSQIPATLGWYQMPNTKLRSVNFPDNYVDTYLFNFYFPNHINSWNSGVFDSLRNRLVTFGGGHDDYHGNEIYAIDLDTLTVSHLTVPAFPAQSGECPESLAGGTQPNSRHTYDGLAYVTHLDKMFVYGGSKSVCGFLSKGTWMFNFSTNLWEALSPSGTIPSDDPGVCTAYDPARQIVWLHDNHALFSYNPATNAYTKYNNSSGIDYHLTGVLDPVRKRFFLIGQGSVWWYDVSVTSTYFRQSISTSGGDAIVNAAYPGLEWDPVGQRIIAWNGGDTVYALNQDTGVWTPITYPNGPGAKADQGTFGRWAYSPTSGVFVVVNSVDRDAYTLRLTTAGGDSTPPTVPTNLSASPTSSTQVNLTWTASTDNVGVVGYTVFRCQGAGCSPSTQVATAAGNSFSDSGLAASTTYVYTVDAFDVTQNHSNRSATATATTLGLPPPTDIVFGYPMTTLQDEKDTYTRWGWSWNVNLEPNYPSAAGYTVSDPDIHGDTESDDLWNYLVQYRRTAQAGFQTRMNVWANYYKTGYEPCVGTSGRTYCADRSNYGLDHLWGWGLISLYESTSHTDTIALSQAQAIAADLETLWAPGSPFGCLPSGGCIWYGLRQASRHLLFITRLTERDSNPRWSTLRDKIIDIFINSAQWDAVRGTYFFGDSQTDNSLGAGAYAAGARIQSPFQLGWCMEAFFHAYRVTGNAVLRDRMISMARYVYQYGLDPNYQYTGSEFGFVNGQLYHNYFANCGTTCTFTDPSMTTSLVDTLVLGYKYTGDVNLLNQARVHFNRGTKAFYGSINRLSADNVVNHFVDTIFDNSTGNLYFAYNKGELQYTYLIFENGGAPTILFGAAPAPPTNFRIP